MLLLIRYLDPTRSVKCILPAGPCNGSAQTLYYQQLKAGVNWPMLCISFLCSVSLGILAWCKKLVSAKMYFQRPISDNVRKKAICVLVHQSELGTTETLNSEILTQGNISILYNLELSGWGNLASHLIFSLNRPTGPIQS